MATAPQQQAPPRRAPTPRAGNGPAFWRNLPPWLRTLLPWVAAFVIAALIPVLDGDSSQIDTLVSAMSFAILALGLNIVVGYAGLLDLGYAAFYAIGAYTFAMIGSAQFQPGKALVLNVFGVHLFSMGQNGIHANFWIFLPIVALVAAFFGVILVPFAGNGSARSVSVSRSHHARCSVPNMRRNFQLAVLVPFAGNGSASSVSRFEESSRTL